MSTNYSANVEIVLHFDELDKNRRKILNVKLLRIEPALFWKQISDRCKTEVGRGPIIFGKYSAHELMIMRISTKTVWNPLLKNFLNEFAEKDFRFSKINIWLNIWWLAGKERI